MKPPNSCTLFFDDTDRRENQFLGLVTSNGHTLVMQPSLYARFTTDYHHERAYLCDGKSGLIEKQIQYHLNTPGTQSALSNHTQSNDEDDILPPLFDNTIQLQLNSSMQLEYHNPTNIRFAFACQKEEYKYQLGTQFSTPTPTLQDPSVTSLKKKNQTKSKLPTNVQNDVIEKQQIQVERLLDGHVNVKELPMMKELILMRKRIRNLCNGWLRDCRIILGKIKYKYNSIQEIFHF